MTISLEERWSGIQADPLRSVFQLVDANHPLDFYLGCDSEERLLFLLVTSERPPALRDLRSILIKVLKREDGKWSLLLTLESALLAPMFALLCDDLVESSRDTGVLHKSALSFVLRRLASWRQLLERGMPVLLTESEVRGLCGELLFLLELFSAIGTWGAVNAWVGPNSADQDFQIPDCAWEVKTIRPGALTVIISSELQLWSLQRAVQLVVFELAESSLDAVGAFTLNSLINSIRELLASEIDASDLFEQQLAAARYVRHPQYSEIAFVQRGQLTYLVKDGFPRITRDDLIRGVSRVRYELTLSECSQFRTQRR